MARTFQGVMWLSATAVIVGFFLPWATLDIRTTQLEREIAAHARRGFARAFSGAKPSSWGSRKPSRGMPLIPSRVSGFQVPMLANRPNVRVATSLVAVFTKKQEQVGLKSWVVYLLPLIALVCAWLMTICGEQRWMAAGTALVCAGIGGSGLWVLLTTNTRALYAISIGVGLWLSLAAYLVMALAAGASALPFSWQARMERLLGPLAHTS